MNQYFLIAIQRMNLTTVIQSLTRTLPVAASESDEEDEDIDDDLRLGYERFIIAVKSCAAIICCFIALLSRYLSVYCK